MVTICLILLWKSSLAQQGLKFTMDQKLGPGSQLVNNRACIWTQICQLLIQSQKWNTAISAKAEMTHSYFFERFSLCPPTPTSLSLARDRKFSFETQAHNEIVQNWKKSQRAACQKETSFFNLDLTMWFPLANGTLANVIQAEAWKVLGIWSSSSLVAETAMWKNMAVSQPRYCRLPSWVKSS